jgi:transcription initiation factor TFIID TATA-box-binding protein
MSAAKSLRAGRSISILIGMSEMAETAVPTETIEVQNVVGSGDLGRELDLAAVAMDLPETEYNPEKMPGLLYRTSAPEATVMLFASGKVVVMGTTTDEGMRRAFKKCVTTFRNLGMSLDDVSELEMQNIVASAEFGERVNLTAAAVGLGLEQVEYEPEQFPGLMYHLAAPEVVVLLFGSGKAVVVGATECESIETAVETVATRLTDLGLLDGD